MSAQNKRIGIETQLMTGNMTGIGNYAFYLLSALTASYADLEYQGYGQATWVRFDSATLQRTAKFQQKDLELEKANPGILSYLGVELRQRASRSHFFRRLYRQAHRRAFASTVRSQRLDLFHALNYIPPSDPGVPVLPVVYDLSFVRYPSAHPPERLRWLEPLGDLVKNCRLIQTISEFSRAEIINVFGVARERIFVAPPAASPIYRPLGRDASMPHLHALNLAFGSYLLAVGTLEPRKNLRTLIAAYGRLAPAARERAPLVVVGGSGWGNIDLPQEAEALNNSGMLRFIGSVSDPVLRSLYEGAIALLFPSIYEGFGMPVVEAMSCGTTVVHSANTSVDEITAGLCARVNALDIEAWTTEMERLIAGGQEANSGNRRALINRASEYDWNESAKTVHAAYDMLL